MSAIQLVQAGPPAACPACMMKIIARNTIIAAGLLSGFCPIIHSGISAIGNHINLWR